MLSHPGVHLLKRYAWEDFPECALYNAAGLPMLPFNVTLSPTAVAAAAGPGASEVALLRAELKLAHAEVARLKMVAVSGAVM